MIDGVKVGYSQWVREFKGPSREVFEGSLGLVEGGVLLNQDGQSGIRWVGKSGRSTPSLAGINHEQMKQDHTNWKMDESDGSILTSIEKIMIPWLGVEVPAWFDMEEAFAWWTEKQEASFKQFLNLDASAKLQFESEMLAIYQQELEKGRILPYPIEDVVESVDWEKSHINIPHHYETTQSYILLLPETRWELPDSEYTLELELLYTNGELELIQESTGLWARLEWYHDYLKR